MPRVRERREFYTHLWCRMNYFPTRWFGYETQPVEIWNLLNIKLNSNTDCWNAWCKIFKKSVISHSLFLSFSLSLHQLSALFFSSFVWTPLSLLRKRLETTAVRRYCVRRLSFFHLACPSSQSGNSPKFLEDSKANTGKHVWNDAWILT